jgi:transposase
MENKMASSSISDTTLSGEYFDTLRRSEHLEPEKTLLLTKLEDAIHDYRKYSFARDPVGKERLQEAEDWIMQAETDWIFSFENVCELLGLDPAYLQRGLLEAQPQTTRAGRKRKRDDLLRKILGETNG